ncbi:Deoxyguanosinetriphosphate triphosphohydrolase [Fulvivirga imtechensis AK7]|uniref:Deoxyguanosinetriphosphate triphosphohydrolase n=1 Tax=Fulvivirga imtechensis AK7 TaxID=1237149 RepID=L8JX67_9BACT|nr:HD domain-containing protein [Fulvivirga imtechensis]ELR71807.1 Deoxyguanosinetriphosphate triphosphohydrolase [Fulvivirga imtechensis AK7]
MNRKKIFNDPVYGFINIKNDLVFDIIEHPVFQRLRRIKQLGLTDFVYPGALHTRFHHAIGAMHLMTRALDSLRSKDIEITDSEYEAAQAAILLHDIGHGPFSHALEYSLLKGIQHESLSFLLMKYLNKMLGNRLEMALKIFQNTYKKRFLHQLVSSQLDMDRLDYLKRDSFFTGVSEGAIGLERIISMLNVVDDQIVVEEKGIYSIENFLNARRLMYWQVYLHKASVSAEKMLINLIVRARDLTLGGREVFASPALKTFLSTDKTLDDFQQDEGLLETFGILDDYDIWGAIKVWQSDEDKILNTLSKRLLNRQLFKIKLSNDPLSKEDLKLLRNKIADQYNVLRTDSRYFYAHGEVTNKAYIAGGQKINILTKKGKVIDIAEAADLPNIKAMSKIVKKYYLCCPKNVSL